MTPSKSWLRAAVAAALLPLAACSGSGPHTAAACAADDLKAVALGNGGETGMNQYHDEVLLRAASDQPCVLRGYPKVRLLNGDGSQFRHRVGRGAGIFPGPSVRALLLRPGGSAGFWVSGNAYDIVNNRPCPEASAIAVRVPGDSRWVTVDERPIACPRGYVDVTPFGRENSGR
jgi:hypothetical protein